MPTGRAFWCPTANARLLAIPFVFVEVSVFCHFIDHRIRRTWVEIKNAKQNLLSFTVTKTLQLYVTNSIQLEKHELRKCDLQQLGSWMQASSHIAVHQNLIVETSNWQYNCLTHSKVQKYQNFTMAHCLYCAFTPLYSVSQGLIPSPESSESFYEACPFTLPTQNHSGPSTDVALLQVISTSCEVFSPPCIEFCRCNLH